MTSGVTSVLRGPKRSEEGEDYDYNVKSGVY